MKKFLLLFSVILLLNADLASSQDIMKNRGRSFREVDDYHKVLNSKTSTDRAHWYIAQVQGWEVVYPIEATYRQDSITLVTTGRKIDYDLTFHDLYYAPDKAIEECLDNGIYYVFSYKRLSEAESKARKKFIKKMNDDEKKAYIKSQLDLYPGCNVEPLLSEEYGDRFLEKKSYYDIHHHMWRYEVPAAKFSIKQTLETVELTSGVSKKAKSVPELLSYFKANELWDYMMTETDSASYLFAFTTSEGRAAIIAFYMEKGRLMEELLVPRPKAKFNNFSFTIEATNDVYRLRVRDGVVNILLYPSIGGSKLTRDPEDAIRWQADFAENSWQRIGKVPAEI